MLRAAGPFSYLERFKSAPFWVEEAPATHSCADVLYVCARERVPVSVSGCGCGSGCVCVCICVCERGFVAWRLSAET